MTAMLCPIDNATMIPIFKATILGKYHVDYYQCPSCNLVQPEKPYWLPEAYQSAIADTDVGLVLRNTRNSIVLRPILHRLHSKTEKILDVGGGYGLLCRSLRDAGFDCYTTDPYCENLFAKGFEPEREFVAETLLAFEVYEHISDPLEFTREHLDKYGAERIIFSTVTHEGNDPPPQDWWYYAFETGQHISLYQKKSLAALAAALSIHYFAINPDLHILSRQPIMAVDRLLLSYANPFLRRSYRLWTTLRRRDCSLTQFDYEAIKARIRSTY